MPPPKQAAFGGGQPNHRKSESLSLEAVEFVGFAALENFSLERISTPSRLSLGLLRGFPSRSSTNHADQIMRFAHGPMRSHYRPVHSKSVVIVSALVSKQVI